jgi:hypothetical protein
MRFPSLFESSAVRRQQIVHRIFPGQFAFDSLTSVVAHHFPFLRMLEQPEKFGGEVGDQVVVVAAVE